MVALSGQACKAPGASPRRAASRQGLGGVETREQVDRARTRQVARQGARKNSELDGAEFDRWTR